MPELSECQKLERQKYVAAQSPMLLGQILSGAALAGQRPDAKACADLAVESAEALFDRLIVIAG